MRQEVGRRAFVGALIAGAPVLAGVPSLLAQGVARGRSQGGLGTAPVDPFIAYSVRELGAIARRARASQKLRGEDARAAAQVLRTAVVYLRGTDGDATALRALHAAIDADGRDSVLYAEVDKGAVTEQMRQYGFDVPGWPDVGGLDYPARAALLDDLIAGGVTPLLAREADGLARVSVRLDQQAAAAATPIARVQDQTYWTAYCMSLSASIAQLQADANMVAFAAWWNSDLWGAYVLIQAAIGVDQIVYAASCY